MGLLDVFASVNRCEGGHSTSIGATRHLPSCARNSIRTHRAVSVCKTAPPGEAPEKFGAAIGHSLSYGESLGPFRETQMPFMPPNGALAAD